MTGCCQPGGVLPRAAGPRGVAVPRAHAPRRDDTVLVPKGVFLMGNDRPPWFPGDGEGPVRAVHLGPFRIDAATVSVEQFAGFVEATGWVSDAERIGWSFVFAGRVPPGAAVLKARVPAAPWWLGVPGADWRRPDGPGSEAEPDHPVVHVSWHDADAYARWAGARLPTEAEWEKAARGGLEQQRYPWGDEIVAGQANVWEGEFPVRRTNGPAGTLPARSLEPNGLGLYHVAGNVWEWTADLWAPGRAERVVKGGSYLCHPSYCHRYRVAGRTFTDPASSTGHTGFRCALDVPPASSASAVPQTSSVAYPAG